MNKNNLFRFLMIFPLVALTFATCKEEDETVTPSLSIVEADKTQAFEAAGGSKIIVVTATAAFTATVEADKAWCTVSELTESLFKLNVAENTETEAREAKVTLSLEGAPDVEITVSQTGIVSPPEEAAILMVSPHMFVFETPLAGERTVTVTTNRTTYTATVETGKTWVTTEINGTILKIKVAESKVEAEREAKITVHVDGAKDVELHVKQAAYVPPVPITTPTAQWNVAAPGTIKWYKRGDNRTIGTEATGAPSTVDAPGGIKAWALGKDDHIRVENPLTAPSTTYTLLWDVRVATLSGYCSLLQTKEDNDDGDGDVFINGKKIGLGSYSGDVLTENTWHRIVVTVDVDAASETKQAIFYVDGQPAYTKAITSDGDIDRYTLQNIFWLFLDDGDEVYPIDCAGVVLWNVALPAGEVLTAGTVGSRLQ